MFFDSRSKKQSKYDVVVSRKPGVLFAVTVLLGWHCQKFGSKWRTRVRIESLMAAKSCKEMYGISTKIQNTTTTSYNIP